jgi:hypothetical protein
MIATATYPTTVQRLPIINGFVSIPDGQILYPTKLTSSQVISLIPGSKVVKIGIHKDDADCVELPAYQVSPPEDWYAILRAAAK